MQENHQSSGVFDTKKHSNVKSKPEYRRVRKYYKSAGRWREERERRKKVLQLFEQGLSYSVIAEQLSVSERTVKRDMAKIRPYYERKIASYMRRVEQERRAKVEAELAGKSLSEQLKILQRMWVNYSKLVKQREYLRRQLTVTIDLDALVAGNPAIKVAPKPPFSIKYPFSISFELTGKGKRLLVGGLTISSEPKRATRLFG
jgi:hypothetical protein